MTTTRNDELTALLARMRPAAVALSGGVDSMTLARVAHDVLGPDVTMFHASSAAVPRAALERIREHADRLGWRLRVVDAGEFRDERYLANPGNRCFFCKSNLYGTLASLTDAQLLSGTNCDDLGDWRPGLRAASDHEVRHPFVEAGMSKADVRALARRLGLDDVAELPSAPCLSSRVETGLPIVPRELVAIDRIETSVRALLGPATVRCRRRHDGLVLELDEPTLHSMGDDIRQMIIDTVRDDHGLQLSRLEVYRRGSAFLRDDA